MNKKRLIIELVIGLAIPALLVSSLSGKVSDLMLLVIGGIAPSIFALYSVIKKDNALIAFYSLLGFVLGIIASLVFGGNAIYLKLSHPAISIMIALTFIISVMIKRPVIYSFAIKYTSDAVRDRLLANREKYLKNFSEMTIGCASITMLNASFTIFAALTFNTDKFFILSRIASMFFTIAMVLFIRSCIVRMKAGK